jgi:hypothetical protein
MMTADGMRKYQVTLATNNQVLLLSVKIPQELSMTEQELMKLSNTALRE